jgi:hypothetical protein
MIQFDKKNLNIKFSPMLGVWLSFFWKGLNSIISSIFGITQISTSYNIEDSESLSFLGFTLTI